MPKRTEYLNRTGKVSLILNEVSVRTGIDRRIVTGCVNGFFNAIDEIIGAREMIRIAGFFTIKLRFSERMKDILKEQGLAPVKRKKKTQGERFDEFYKNNRDMPTYTLAKKFKLKLSYVLARIQEIKRLEKLAETK